jgi:uncharacterized protein YkwD
VATITEYNVISRRLWIQSLSAGLVVRLGCTAQATDLARQTFVAVNKQRRNLKLTELAWNDRVAAAARSHSARMMKTGIFSHRDPVFGALTQRLSKAGIAWRLCGENIFNEKGDDDPVGYAVKSWMKSPAHKANILEGRFTHTGVGVTVDEDSKYFFTQIFIAR